MTGTLIATQGDENWVLSADGAYIYVAGNDGHLRVFDALSGESLHSVDLGADLGAISLSPDGTRLVVVEEVPENVQQYQSWTQNSADVSFYIVDLSTFDAQELTYHVTAEGYTFADVTWTDNDTLQLSQNILPGWSGWAPLATVELATGALTEHSSYYSGLGTSASLLTIPDSNTVLLGQLGLSSAQYFLIGPDGTALTNNGIYNNDVYGYAGGIEAASGTTASDRIIIVTGGGAHLYDGTMSYIGNLARLYPNLGSAAGVTFSADGQRLFFLDSTNKAVVVVDAYNYSVVATVALTGVIFETLQWGEEIVVAPDGNGIYYNTSTGISYVAVGLPGLGTDGADQLSGTAGDDDMDGRGGADDISGLAGDDWLIGGSGNDRLDGGDGFDIAAYETATSGVSVDLGIAGAQATGGADSDALVSIEGLSGSAFNDTLTGNALDNVLLGYDGNDSLSGNGGDDDLYGENGHDLLFGGAGIDWLFGGSGDDRLDGGTGADRLEGGDGNDTYVLDDAGDTVLETATGGYDTMRVSNFNATIASGVEALILVSGPVNATGNFAANSLTGSDQANVLSGLAGNDVLDGLAGNDVLIGGAGNDTLSGGTGIDTAVYSGLYRLHQVSGNGASVTGGNEGTDTLSSVELVQFQDGRLQFDPDGFAAQVTRLYDTVLQRVPDQAGLDLWVDLLEAGRGSLKDVARGFLNSPEFQARTGSLSNADYVEFLYQNALGRASDSGGKAYWVGQLNAGADRADLLMGFSESVEHRGLTASLVAQGFFNTDDAYQAVALLYDSFAGRQPDPGGLITWAEAIRSGAQSLDQVADQFAASAEFRGLTAGMTNGQIVEFMYQNTLDRASDPGGLAYWTGRLNAGMDRGDLLIAFSQSQEHFFLLGPQITNGIDLFG